MTSTLHGTAAEPFSPTAAAETIRDLVMYDEPLRRRTEGVTWMVWGLVTIGVLLSMPAAEAAFGWPRMSVVLVAWIALGFGLSKGVWTLAATAVPRLKPTLARTALAAVVILAVWMVAGWAGNLVWPSAEGGSPGGYGLAMLGTVWVVVGALNVRPRTPVGRRVLVAIGTLLIAVGALYVVLETRGRPAEAWGVFLMAAPAGGIPFLAGLWQALRG